MIHLDTHVVVWLYAGRVDLLPPPVRALVEQEEIAISPIVLLELQYLRETGRIQSDPLAIIDDLGRVIEMTVSCSAFDEVIREACRQTWTRDPFDRMIVAHARVDAVRLLTKDRTIRRNYQKALWPRRADY